MKKNIVLLFITSVLLLATFIFLIYMSKYNTTAVSGAKISQEYISKIEKGDNLVDKRLLLNSYKAHNRYVDVVTKLNTSYANALEKTYLGMIFLILLQFVLLFKILRLRKRG